VVTEGGKEGEKNSQRQSKGRLQTMASRPIPRLALAAAPKKKEKGESPKKGST